jgi:polar amino acid transport system substrate-binding protein
MHTREFWSEADYWPQDAILRPPKRAAWSAGSFWRATAVGLVGWVGLVGCSQAPEEEVTRIGYAVEPPYAFINADGEVTGESPEVARAVLRQLGVKRVEWRLMEFRELLPELMAGRVDVVASGLFITEERKAKVAFSRPTFQAWPGLLVERGNPLGLTSYEVVKEKSARVAVLTGAYEEVQLRQVGVSATHLIPVPDAITGWQMVLTKRADALALTGPTVRWMAKEGTGGQAEAVTLWPRGVGEEKVFLGGFAFRKADRARRAAWDGVLAEWLGSEAHRTTVSRFGFGPKNLPGAVRELTTAPQAKEPRI